MIRPFLLSATLLGALAAPAWAQNSLSSSQTPPPANSSSGTAQTTNSLPTGASTATRDRPGNDVGTTRVSPVAPSAPPASR